MTPSEKPPVAAGRTVLYVPVTEERWATARAAVAAVGARFANLVATSDGRTMATADWSVADTAAHVTGIAYLYTHLVRSDEPAVPSMQDQVLATTVDTVAALNARMLGVFRERDPALLASQLRANIDEILLSTKDADPAALVTWLGDSKIPLCGVLAHLCNELHIHGRDIARATRRPWPVRPADAALFFETFFVEALRNGIGHLLDGGAAPTPRRVAVAFHSRHTTPVTIVVREGEVSIADPDGPVDAHVRFDPVALNLMLFHRISKTRAAITGKITVWGRRPWLLPAFLGKVRCP